MRVAENGELVARHVFDHPDYGHQGERLFLRLSDYHAVDVIDGRKVALSKSAMRGEMLLRDGTLALIHPDDEQRFGARVEARRIVRDGLAGVLVQLAQAYLTGTGPVPPHWETGSIGS